jgi:CubicO group peptidase (beta-lactamase class C family)
VRLAPRSKSLSASTMMLTQSTAPTDLGISAAAWSGITARLDALAENAAGGGGTSSTPASFGVHGGCLALARSGLVLTHAFGSSPPPSAHNQAGLRDSVAIEEDSVFLVASLTKPATCTAVVQLIGQGRLSLDTPVHTLLPRFTGGGREKVTVRHLLTHTSGLPDGIPENQEFRRRHAPLSEFADRMCELELLFEPGTSISYQSAGINLLGSIVQLVSGQALPVYLRENVFGPLGMRDTTLGIASDRAKGREVPCFLDPTKNEVQAADVLPTEQHSERDCCAFATFCASLIYGLTD